MKLQIAKLDWVTYHKHNDKYYEDWTLQILRYVFRKWPLIIVLSGITHFRVDIFEGCVNISWSIFDMLSIIYCFSWIYSTAFKTKIEFSGNDIIINNGKQMTGSGLSKLEKSNLDWTELPDSSKFSSVRTTLIKRNIYFSYNYPSSLLDVFESCLYHVHWN